MRSKILKCPKCDITDLDVSLLVHVLSDHLNGTFGELDLLNAILHSNYCDQVSDLITSSSISDLESLETFLNMV